MKKEKKADGCHSVSYTPQPKRLERILFHKILLAFFFPVLKCELPGSAFHVVMANRNFKFKTNEITGKSKR